MMDRGFIVLFEICKRMRSRDDVVHLCSCELGEYLDVSQQSASRYLSELESKGFIVRHPGHRLSLTDEGISVLDDVFLNLRSFFEGPGDPVSIVGRVASGFGEGAYYINEYFDRLEKHLGFKPFPGTLNIKPNQRFSCLERYASGLIKGFSRRGRSFGALLYVPARVSVHGKVERCFVVLPKRTHHKDDLEIVCKCNLREKFNLSDGDLVEVTLGLS